MGAILMTSSTKKDAMQWKTESPTLIVTFPLGGSATEDIATVDGR